MAVQKRYGRFFHSETSKEVSYAALNKKTDEAFRKELFDNYGFITPKEWSFYTLGKDSIWLIPDEASKFDTKDLIIETKGLYFSHYDGEYLRLTPEGAQIVGKTASKNILDITIKEAEDIIRGFDIDKTTNLDAQFVILRSPKGIIGVGKNHKTKVLCQIAKNRRVHQL